MNNNRHLCGFTLTEVIFAVGILAFCLSGLLVTYINMFFLSDLMRDITLASNTVQAKMEEIKNTPFNNLADHNGPFDLDGFSSVDSQGWITVSGTSYANLREIRIVACFQSRGRLIGDSVANCTASPVEMVSLIVE